MELRPCPFCGSTMLTLMKCWDIPQDSSDHDAIICYGCLATFTQQELTCDDDLIEAWNRRASDDDGK